MAEIKVIDPVKINNQFAIFSTYSDDPIFNNEIISVDSPIYCAGGNLYTSVRKRENVGAALGSNILGAMFGGFGEHLSLIMGVSNLSLIAILIYFLSIFFRKKV